MSSAKYENLKSAFQHFAGKSTPSLHCVLGSGIAGALEDVLANQSDWKQVAEIPFSQIKAFPSTTVVGHKGSFVFLEKDKTFVILQTGRFHGYEGHEPSKVVLPLRQSAELGTKKFLLTNAAGSLKKEWAPGSAMIITDQVNFSGKNPLFGPNPIKEDGKEWGPRFPDMSRAYCPELSQQLKKCVSKHITNVYEGTYIGVLGPSFETPAEIKLFGSWGMGSVGMSTVWENIALNHMGLKVVGLSFLSNYGSGILDEPLSHEEVLKTGQASAEKLMQAVLDFSATQI